MAKTHIPALSATESRTQEGKAADTVASRPVVTVANEQSAGQSGQSEQGKGGKRGGQARKHPRVRKIGPPLPPPRLSGRLLVRVAPSQVGMFRFLLEAYEHVAYFTVLNKYEALLKIVFSPHREYAARQALKEIGWSLPIDVVEWPC